MTLNVVTCTDVDPGLLGRDGPGNPNAFHFHQQLSYKRIPAKLELPTNVITVQLWEQANEDA